MNALIAQLLSRVHHRLANMLARAVLRLVDDTLPIQRLQVEVLPTEVRVAERFQEYGYTSVPLIGAQAVMLFAGGRRNHPIAVAVDDRRYRPTGLQPGEVCVYTDEGDSVLFSRGRVVEVVAGEAINVTCPTVNMSGNLNVGGTIIAGSDVVASGISLVGHVHGGVLAGGAVTGGPQ